MVDSRGAFASHNNVVDQHDAKDWRLMSIGAIGPENKDIVPRLRGE
jgi:hypothetical protein